MSEKTKSIVYNLELLILENRKNEFKLTLFLLRLKPIFRDFQ